jgi:hypothetical protein
MVDRVVVADAEIYQDHQQVVQAILQVPAQVKEITVAVDTIVTVILLT